jgi:hypothetical protein
MFGRPSLQASRRTGCIRKIGHNGKPDEYVCSNRVLHRDGSYHAGGCRARMLRLQHAACAAA